MAGESTPTLSAGSLKFEKSEARLIITTRRARDFYERQIETADRNGRSKQGGGPTPLGPSTLRASIPSYYLDPYSTCHLLSSLRSSTRQLNPLRSEPRALGTVRATFAQKPVKDRVRSNSLCARGAPLHHQIRAPRPIRQYFVRQEMSRDGGRSPLLILFFFLYEI